MFTQICKDCDVRIEQLKEQKKKNVVVELAVGATAQIEQKDRWWKRQSNE